MNEQIKSGAFAPVYEFTDDRIIENGVSEYRYADITACNFICGTHIVRPCIQCYMKNGKVLLISCKRKEAEKLRKIADALTARLKEIHQS